MSADDLDGAVAADETEEAAGGEAEEIGAVGGVGEGGVPEVAFLADVAYVVDEGTPFVVYPEFVHGVLSQFEEVDDAPSVVDAVAVGGDDVGELEPCGDDFDGVCYGIHAGVMESPDGLVFGNCGVEEEGESGVLRGKECDVEGA